MTTLEDKRAIYLPEDHEVIRDPNSSAVAYTYETIINDHLWFVVMGFCGRRSKCDFHYRYKMESERENKITRYFERVTAREQDEAERREKRKTAPLGLKVGDVLSGLWGWEQSNVDYYQVTGLHGKRTVELRPIAARREEKSYMSGDCWPVVGKFTGPAFRKQARDGWVRINSVVSARLKKPTESGEYLPDCWSSYA